MKVSVIVPVFNEQNAIQECLDSLFEQTEKDVEIIIVDDGSTDKGLEIIRKYPVKLLIQSHQGPGLARNKGAREAKGEVLIFVDADMVFKKDFISALIKPIKEGKTIGTFSKDEFVLNKDNIWSKCWNLNKKLPFDRMHGDKYPDEQPVFRAILKEEFDKTDGFKPIGYIDDYTVSKQLGHMATVAKNAVFYHRNPETLSEVYSQARWIGKSEYKGKKIKNENLMRIIALFRYSLIFTLIHGIKGSIILNDWRYLLFKITYDIAIEISLIKSFFKEQIYK